MTQQPPSRQLSWLPPGQVETAKFLAVGERQPALEALDLNQWRLHLEGAVEEPLILTYEQFLALPQQHCSMDVHCVTGWSRQQRCFTGVPLRLLLEKTRPQPKARFVQFIAFSPRAHDTSLPLEVARTDTWLVHSVDGAALSVEHGYPLRTVTTSRYFYKSLKWVHTIVLLAEDSLGYWERAGYHNNADPWGEERYISGSLSPHRLEAFKNAEQFTSYRGKILLGLDLRDWCPRFMDLSGLQLKNCDLRGARLNGTHWQGANLTHSDLRGASLRHANLDQADLEGANFAGADLSGANLSHTLLTATRFFERLPDGTLYGACLDNVCWSGAAGLLEEQEAYLRSPERR